MEALLISGVVAVAIEVTALVEVVVEELASSFVGVGAVEIEEEAASTEADVEE